MFNQHAIMYHYKFSLPAIARAIETSLTRDTQEIVLTLLARAESRAASQNQPVIPMTDQELAEYNDRRYEALRVAEANTVSLRLEQNQGAQVERTQRAQERLHRSAPATNTGALTQHIFPTLETATGQEEERTRRREVARATDPRPGATAERERIVKQYREHAEWEEPTMNSSRLKATQHLQNATARILSNRTEAERAAVDRIFNPREPHIAEANVEIILANLIQRFPDEDWVETFMEITFTNVLVQNAEVAQVRAETALQPTYPFCQTTCISTDRDALQKVFGTGGNPVIEECFLCTDRK
jgi:hypothetical protein